MNNIKCLNTLLIQKNITVYIEVLDYSLQFVKKARKQHK